jgi:hypothetical protein
MSAMDQNLQFRVACILLLQAHQELLKTNSPLAKEIDTFLEGVISEMEAIKQ